MGLMCVLFGYKLSYRGVIKDRISSNAMNVDGMVVLN